MSKEFNSIDEIDAFLEEMFANEDKPEDEPEKPETDEEPDLENEDESDQEDNEDVSNEEDNEDEEGDEVDEEPEAPEKPAPKPKKPSAEEKQNHAFAKLRTEASEYKRKADEYDEVIKTLMEEAGFDDFNQFKSAVKQQVKEKAIKEGRMTEAAYDKMENLDKREKEIRQREQQIKQNELNLKAKLFNDAVVEFATEYGLGEAGVGQAYERLEELGYTVEALLAQPDPKVLIRGVMADEVERIALAEYRKKANPKKAVDSGKLPTSNKQKTLEQQQNELLDSELRQYAKRIGVSYND